MTKNKWIAQFLEWLKSEDLPEYGDRDEMFLLAESFYNENPECPLGFDELVNSYYERKV
jgi:hypothetical protein